MTTRPTLEADRAVGATPGSTEWNVNCLQQARWVQEVIAGTNTDKIPGAAFASPLNLPGRLTIDNDANFLLYRNAPYSIIQMDTGSDDYLYDRTNNLHLLRIGGTVRLQINANGKISGSGIYDSGDVSVANGVTQPFNTGFAVDEGPFLVWGLYGATAGSSVNNVVGASVSAVRFGTTVNNQVNVFNGFGATRVVRVWALTRA